jgi:hypothetical protein
MTHVPDEFFPASLHLPILKGKSVVSQVWDCPGFYMYLSNRCALLTASLFTSPPMNKNALFLTLASEEVTVNLRANFTHPAAPGVNMNPSVTFGWSAEGCTGVRQYAYQPDAVYTPLFCLRSIRRPLLRRGDSEKGPGREV